jgi:uncharacterized protein
MKLKTYKLGQVPASRPYGLLFFSALIIYVALILCGLVVLNHRIPYVAGQLTGGETANSGQSISRNLDLRIAAKNAYPSSPLTVVRVLGTSGGVRQEIISFTVPDDGLTEYGLAMLPATPIPAGGYPAIILCHGYVTPSKYLTTSSYLSDMNFYAQHGFVVINPDFRGQGLSLDQGRPDSAFYSMAYNTDVMSLISSLKKTNYINKSNINFWGFSMGAYIALRATVLSSDIKNLILLSGPVDSLSKMYLTYIPSSDENNLDALKTRQNMFSKYGIPVENTAFWKYASPINLLSRIKANVQINVGSLDQTVPPQFSADLNAALNKTRVKHQYYVYSDGEHSLEAQRGLIWQRSLQILSGATQSS